MWWQKWYKKKFNTSGDTDFNVLNALAWQKNNLLHLNIFWDILVWELWWLYYLHVRILRSSHLNNLDYFKLRTWWYWTPCWTPWKLNSEHITSLKYFLIIDIEIFLDDSVYDRLNWTPQHMEWRNNVLTKMCSFTATVEIFKMFGMDGTVIIRMDLSSIL